MRGVRRRQASPVESVVVGPARVDRRTKDLVKRLRPGDIAVIDHEDLDRVAADSLVAAGAVAVVNAARSITGRYPNGGPIRVVTAGIPLIDDTVLINDTVLVGDTVTKPEQESGAPAAAGNGRGTSTASPASSSTPSTRPLMDLVHEGDILRIDDGKVWRAGECIAQGRLLTSEEVEAAMTSARDAIGAELERFAENTLEYVRREAAMTFEPLELPPLQTKFKGRHALVVVRGYDYRADLAALRTYIREYRPALIGVDGGADALLEVGLTPDVILGDFDSVSAKAIEIGAELVHHVHPDGRAPGRENLLAWGVSYHEFVAEGTSEDVAMLLAYEAGAQLIVAVGTHATMVEFLDKGRRGMASTFLTRLRLGPTLVDAKGVSRLYQGRIRRLDWILLVGSALVVIATVVAVSEQIQTLLDGFWLTLRDLWHSITG